VGSVCGREMDVVSMQRQRRRECGYVDGFAMMRR
jgi:hypothetical protein